MTNPNDCTHRELRFNSGDYYLTCTACGGTWMRRGTDGRPEYGEANGKPIGADPEASNNGPGQYLSGKVRIAKPEVL